MAQRFFIIDGLSQIFRCYYAPFQALTAPTGEPTRATYVFTNMLLQLVREQKPDYLAMAMDCPAPDVFRREFASDYKAHRDLPPEDLTPQIERILQIIGSQHIPVLQVPGYEADDVMATLGERLCKSGLDLVLVSRDKDLDQIVSDCVKLYDPMKDEYVGPAELRKLKGYGPEQAIEVQTLSGDTSDNIPGVKGVGPKKAAALIAKYGSAAEVVAHAEELTPAMRANVLAFAPELERTQRLVTLSREAPIELDVEACRWTGVDWAALQPIVTELGFTRLVQQCKQQVGEAPPAPAVPAQAESSEAKPSAGGVKSSGRRSPPGAADRTSPSHPAPAHFDEHLFGAKPSEEQSEKPSLAASTVSSAEPLRAGEEPRSDSEAPPPGAGATTAGAKKAPATCADKPQYTCVDTPEKFAAFLRELREQRIFAFDTETTSLNPVWARLAGLSFSWDAGKAFYLPICGIGDCLPLEPTLAALRPIFADPNVRKVGQNIKYDLVVLARHGVPVRGVEFDSMVASFVLDSSRRSHSMDALATDVLGRVLTPISDLIGTGRDQIAFDGVITDRATDYSGAHADVTWQLYQALGKRIAGSRVEPLFRDTEMPLVEVLAAMEAEGVRLDTDVLANMSAELSRRLEDLARRIYKEVGHEFNIDSTRQLAVVLFDELKLPVLRQTKTGRSTDADTLDSLFAKTKNPVLGLIREYRELIKLKGTYIDPLPGMICPATGRIHASFNQTTAITGRLSSSDPNLQNIPIRTEIGRQIRRAFVPRDADHVLLTADYSQIELRVLAHFCGDPALRKAFADDLDIHQFVAAQVFGVPLEQVSGEQRGRAKAVNFGIIYGQSAFGLARGTGMTTGQAQDFINAYFLRYPGIREFIERTVAKARRTGVVETILGRRRAVPDINSRSRGLRSAGERFAVNTVMQGSAADLIKRAMINIHRRIVEENRPARMIIQVHDELVFDVPRRAVESDAEMIRHEMCHALPLEVPIKVDLAWGDNWLEGK